MAILKNGIEFTGADENRILGDVWVCEGTCKAVALLLHGGGQTRHAWAGTAERLAPHGVTSITIDHRGHGESDWVESGHYQFFDFARDVTAVTSQIRDRFGMTPISIGASLGGLATLLSQGETDGQSFSGVVLVDIVPWLDPRGVAQITGFMRKHIHEGFASLDEAADAVSSYLPERQRPKSLDGLRKNLRQDEAGRYRWHWDPRFLDGDHSVSVEPGKAETALVNAAASLSVPTLLVRGQRSELVSQEHAGAFLKLVPHSDYADIAEAGHMVAGDKNDVFAGVIVQFVLMNSSDLS